MPTAELGFTSGGVNYTPVRAPRGKLVHAVLIDSSEAACGKACKGYTVVLRYVTCKKCKLALVYPCKRGRR